MFGTVNTVGQSLILVTRDYVDKITVKSICGASATSITGNVNLKAGNVTLNFSGKNSAIIIWWNSNSAMSEYKNLPIVMTSINDIPYGFSYVGVNAKDTPGGTGGFCIMASDGKNTSRLCVFFERRVSNSKKCSVWFRTTDGAGNWCSWTALQ